MSTSSPNQRARKPREAIVETSVALFSELGYTGTTMRDIAKSVGVLPGSLYAHIESKETLLLEIVEEGIERFLAIDTAGATPAERLRSAIKAHVEVVAENPQRTLVVFHQWRYLSEPNRAVAVEKRGRYQKLFSDIIDEGVADGTFDERVDSHVAVLTILGALNWTPEWYSPAGPDSAAEIGEKIADTVLLGLQRGAN